MKITSRAAVSVAVVTFSLSACANPSTEVASSGFDIADVQIESAKSAFYGKPSLASFANSAFVTEVVTGTVTKVESVVYNDADVFTAVTIAVEGPESGEPTLVVTRENGGTATVAQVRSDFEGRVPEEVLDAHGADSIKYTDVDEPQHSEVGQRVVAFLGGDPSSLGGYFTAASLVEAADGSFTWLQGEPPNRGWAKAISKQAAKKFAAER